MKSWSTFIGQELRIGSNLTNESGLNLLFSWLGSISKKIGIKGGPWKAVIPLNAFIEVEGIRRESPSVNVVKILKN